MFDIFQPLSLTKAGQKHNLESGRSRYPDLANFYNWLLVVLNASSFMVSSWIIVSRAPLPNISVLWLLMLIVVDYVANKEEESTDLERMLQGWFTSIGYSKLASSMFAVWHHH